MPLLSDNKRNSKQQEKNNEILKIIIVYLVLVMAIVTSLQWPRVDIVVYISIIMSCVSRQQNSVGKKERKQRRDIVETPLHTVKPTE